MALKEARVLVVDRDGETARVIGRLLRSSGAEVVAVSSGNEAVTEIASTRPDVLLVDVTAAGGEGFLTMAQIRELSPEKGGRVPSASMGASLLDDHLLDVWRRAGFQLHLSKPLDALEVSAVVETLAGRRIERRRAPQKAPRSGQEHERRGVLVL